MLFAVAKCSGRVNLFDPEEFTPHISGPGCYHTAPLPAPSSSPPHTHTQKIIICNPLYSPFVLVVNKDGFTSGPRTPWAEMEAKVVCHIMAGTDGFPDQAELLAVKVLYTKKKGRLSPKNCQV